jgi:hypothetical protein
MPLRNRSRLILCLVLALALVLAPGQLPSGKLMPG